MLTYDELLAGGAEAVERLIGRQETLQLEFKANEPRDPIFVDGALSRPGKKLLAKEASAFANSAGGLIVFGVDCRTVAGIDQADKLTPIPHLARAETTVRDAAADLLQPRHGGIRVASIPSHSNETEGFIIVDVPRSERRPHRSEATDQKQYFKRAGSSSFPMEHYDIEDSFRRVSSPSLELEVTYQLATQIGYDEFHYNMMIGIRNTGDVSAKMVSLQIWDRRGAAYGRDQYSPPLVKESFYDGRTHLAGPTDFAVHPSETRLFHLYTFKAHTKVDGTVATGEGPLIPGSIGFTYALSAENMRMNERSYCLSSEAMAAFDAVFEAAKIRQIGGRPQY